jgi:dTDP-4-dehydrorhamnose reductase
MNLRTSRVLITGASGMLGSAFAEALETDHAGSEVFACGRMDLDVRDRDAVIGFASRSPDLIIHCAADTNADRCESNPSECWNTQVGGTRNVIDLAAATGATVVYPQSFLIFSGGDDAIHSGTEPNPISVYGRCKLEAEVAIRSSEINSLVVRMAGFFGGASKDKNFVGKFTRKIAALLSEGKREYSVGDRIWQPTYTRDLARNTLLLLQHGQTGLWSMACEGEASFYELARETVELLGLAGRFDVLPAPRESNVAGDIAARPQRAVISNAQLHSAGLCIQRDWRVALAEYLENPWFKDLFRDFS